ncbi:MAG: hypothetical protein RLZZ126_2077 [Pseudomonadota bacterium]|jgi:hypothetical protein
MDEIVRQALAKWPQVPHCYGWLGLDARGNWYMRDDGTQAAGPFPSWFDAAAHAPQPSAKGSQLRHDKLIAFIGRNYEADASGQWYFQNGPQRVYVELEAAPWVWRVSLQGQLRVRPHTATTPDDPEVRALECLVDEAGHVFLVCESAGAGVQCGVVHTQDMGAVADALEAGLLRPEQVRLADLPSQYGWVWSPAVQSASNVRQRSETKKS